MQPTTKTKRRALVVDSDAETLAMVAEALNSFRPGFEVATARDLERAGGWLDAFAPDLILIGLEPLERAVSDLSGRIAESGRSDCCTIVVCSDGKADLPANVDANLTKPLNLGDLLGTVRRLV